MANRTITFNLPDGQEDALILEFATFHGWTSDNGFTTAAWAKKVLAEVIKESIKNYRVGTAVGIARTQKETEVNALVIT